MPGAQTKARSRSRSSSPSKGAAAAAANNAPSLSLPPIIDRPSGWGPHIIPQSLVDIPYTPFSKADKLGKVADWINPGGRDGYDDRRDRRHRDRERDTFGANASSAFAYVHSQDDDGSFSLVDRSGAPVSRKSTTAGSTSSRGGFRGGRGGRGGNTGRGGGRGGFRGGRGGARGGRGGFTKRRWNAYNDKQTRLRDASVIVGPEWHMIDEIDFSRLGKLSYEVGEPEDIEAYGSLYYYDKSFDRVNVKNEKPLRDIVHVGFNVTTSLDPVIQKLSKDIEEPTVFATDNVLAGLMCATRSVYGWDLVFTKEGNRLYIDKRDTTAFDLVSVHENAQDPPQDTSDVDNINSASSLALEATVVQNRYLSQIVKESEKYELANADPFFDASAEEAPKGSAGYRYRKWDMGDGITLVARTGVDAVIHTGVSSAVPEKMVPVSSAVSATETQLITVKTLTEYDNKSSNSNVPDWRSKLDTQRGAVIATEIKNNANKLGRWTVESILSGVDQIRLGFVSRASPRDRERHVLLGTSFHKPREFATQMNLKLNNSWGILKVFVDLFFNQLEDGKYVLMKDPNKPALRLYEVPMSTFEDEEGEDGDDMDGGDMEGGEGEVDGGEE